MWTELQTNGQTDGKPGVTLTYTYVKRLDPSVNGSPVFECFVGTTIPNEDGQINDTTTLLLTEAGTGTRCSRLADPFRSGMKLVGTKSTTKGNCIILSFLSVLLDIKLF